MLCIRLRTGFMDYGLYGLWFEYIELSYNYSVWWLIMVNHAEFIIILPNLSIDEMLHLVKQHEYNIVTNVFHYINRNMSNKFSKLTLVDLYMTHGNTLYQLKQRHHAEMSYTCKILRRNNQQQILLAYIIVSYSSELCLLVMCSFIWYCIFYVDVYTTMVHWYVLILLMFKIIILCQKSNIVIRLAIVQCNCRIICAMAALQYDSEGVNQFILYNTENFATINNFDQTIHWKNNRCAVRACDKCSIIHLTTSNNYQKFQFRNSPETYPIIILHVVFTFSYQSVIISVYMSHCIIEPFSHEHATMYVIYMYVMPICVIYTSTKSMYRYNSIIQLLQLICNNCRPETKNKFIHNGGG